VRLIAVWPRYRRSNAAESSHASVADDVAVVADALGIDRYAVLGMSLGGPYPLACEVVHPARVTALGAVASPAITLELAVREGRK
jgi:pimeloyl-ACP methyl ester carboxylesterase